MGCVLWWQRVSGRKKELSRRSRDVQAVGKEELVMFVDFSPPRGAAKKSFRPSLAYDSYHALIHSREPLRLSDHCNPHPPHLLQPTPPHQSHLNIQTDNAPRPRPRRINCDTIASPTCHTTYPTLPTAPVGQQHAPARSKPPQSSPSLPIYTSQSHYSHSRLISRLPWESERQACRPLMRAVDGKCRDKWVGQ